jgi:hypothetical protein
VLLLPQLVNTASSMVALVMIERGAEMFELGLSGRPGPWSNALNIYNALFFMGALLALKPFIRLLDHRRDSAITLVWDRFANLIGFIILGLTGLIALALLLRGLQAGFPLLAGTDRFLFRRLAADKITLYALNLKFVIGYALGFLAFTLPISKWMKVTGKIAFGVMMILYFLFGDKFFTQLAAFSAFMAPYLYANYEKVVRNIWLYMLVGALALSTVMGVTAFIYSDGFTQTSAATSKRFSDRIVGQAELWFLQSSIGAPLLHWDAPLMERYSQSLSVKAIDLFAVQNSLGPNYFSNRYAPDYLRASLQRNAGSVTYTAVTEAMGLALFGWLGLGVYMLSLGLLLGLACAYIGYAIKTRSILSILFAAYVYVQLRTSIVQATPWVIASVYSAKWLAVILAIELGLVVLGRASAGSTPGQGHRGTRLARRIKQTAKPPV